MLCLVYANAVKSEILFTRTGYEEQQANQLGHDCVTLTTDEIVILYFDEALEM